MLKRAETIKHRELAHRSNELAFEEANSDREAALAELFDTHLNTFRFNC
jgi:hypothetical protein